MDNYQLTFLSWNQVADKYQEKFMDVDLYNDTYYSFCNLIENPNASILEIGCGPGNITRYIIAKKPGFEILATDVAPNMLILAKQNNPSISILELDCRNIDKLEGKYDGIMCGFCLPYLSKEDCRKLLNDCNKLISPGGILYLSTMEDDYEKSGFKTGSDGVTRMFQYFHQEDYLTGLLQSNNFEIIEMQRKNCPNHDGTFAIDMIFIARKNK